MKEIKRYVVSALLSVSCLVADFSAYAQTNDVYWKGRSYNLTTDLSPFDSIRINSFQLPLRWHDADKSNIQNFLTSLPTTYYGSRLFVERILTEEYIIQRYIVVSDSLEITVLEKYSYGNGIILYFKNGLAEPEMKFYKLLTSYYKE